MSTAFTIVGLGESLFDVFPDRAILGGAPLNVAYHVHQLCSGSGGRGLVASRVGADELGRRLLEELRMRRLSADFVQIDDAHPTGRVDITLHHGEPTYDFLANVAWDHLEWTPEWRRLAESTDAVVFGTLAQRCPTSRATVQRFVETARQAIRLFDVNLRVAFFDAESLRRGAELATAIKLNADELPIVLRLLGLAEDVSGSVMRGILRRCRSSLASFHSDWPARCCRDARRAGDGFADTRGLGSRCCRAVRAASTSR